MATKTHTPTTIIRMMYRGALHRSTRTANVWTAIACTEGELESKANLKLDSHDSLPRIYPRGIEVSGLNLSQVLRGLTSLPRLRYRLV